MLQYIWQLKSISYRVFARAPRSAAARMARCAHATKRAKSAAAGENPDIHTIRLIRAGETAASPAIGVSNGGGYNGGAIDSIGENGEIMHSLWPKWLKATCLAGQPGWRTIAAYIFHQRLNASWLAVAMAVASA